MFSWLLHWCRLGQKFQARVGLAHPLSAAAAVSGRDDYGFSLIIIKH